MDGRFSRRAGRPFAGRRARRAAQPAGTEISGWPLRNIRFPRPARPRKKPARWGRLPRRSPFQEADVRRVIPPLVQEDAGEVRGPDGMDRDGDPDRAQTGGEPPTVRRRMICAVTRALSAAVGARVPHPLYHAICKRSRKTPGRYRGGGGGGMLAGGGVYPGGGGGGGGRRRVRGARCCSTAPGTWFPFAYMHCWKAMS